MSDLEEQSLDELIQSTREELEHSNRNAERQTPFEPKLPPEYASLSSKEDKPVTKSRGVSPGKKVFIYVAGVLLASILLALFAWVCAKDVCALTRKEQIITVTIEDEESIDQIADKLQDKGLIEQPWLFRLYCSLTHAQRKIRPGTYDLNAVFDYHALVNAMASAGSRATTTVTVPEGYTCRDIFNLLEENEVCTAEELYDAAANGEFEYAFLEGAPKGDKNRLEGCLFPDTYEFYLHDQPESVLKKFLQNTESKLTEELWTALEDLNRSLQGKKANAGFTEEQIKNGTLSMYNILTVASLIEKEAANAQEDSLIASVIYNRLCSKAYPYLNIDAALQYALENRKEVLSDEDKLIDSPYNTYLYPGLPAGAIANPGMLAIRGALYPQESEYYFYALGKDGTHTFTRSYEEHLAFLETLKDE